MSLAGVRIMLYLHLHSTTRSDPDDDDVELAGREKVSAAAGCASTPFLGHL